MSKFDKQLYYWTHMLDEAYVENKTSEYLTEGKHWPDDYEKTFFNMIKASPIYYNLYFRQDNIVWTDITNFSNDVDPHAHDPEPHRVPNVEVGYYATLCKWFIEKAEKGMQSYAHFLEICLPDFIRRIKLLDKNEEKQIRNQIKNGTYEQFVQLTDQILEKAEADDAKLMDNFTASNKGYQLVKIDSYDQLHNMFGGKWTGNGTGDQTAWCHTNVRPTYNNWTKDGAHQMFVLCRTDWQSIQPNVEAHNPFDEYGTSAIAINVDRSTGKLLAATLRYNHAVPPTNGNVDYCVSGYGQLSQIAGFDVRQAVADQL